MSSHSFSNAEIAQLLRQVAALHALKDKDAFRVNAYTNAANSIEQTATSVQELWEQGNLAEIPGIGQRLIEHLGELFSTGKVKQFETLIKSAPTGMLALLDVPGIGPKTAYKLAKALKFGSEKTTQQELLEYAQSGKIATIEGFSSVSERKLLNSLQNRRSRGAPRLLLPQAQLIAADCIAYLKTSPAVLEIEALGSLRRLAPTIGDIDIALTTRSPKTIEEHLAKFPHNRKLVSAGEHMITFVHSSGQQIDVKMVENTKQWGSLLQHYTGSKMHNIRLRTYAQEKGLSLSEYGITKNGKITPYSTEKDFYQALGLPLIPPEMREDMGEIDAALQGELPHLVELSDIKGDLHIHSNFEFASSHDTGNSSVADIAGRAIELGYSYIGFSDHNPKQTGLSSQQRLSIIRKRRDWIESQFRSPKLKILIGMEVDILPSGQLALEDESLSELDYVIASVHSSFTQPTEKTTERLIKALSNPYVKILGHPTGRILEEREGIHADWKQIFAHCAKHNILLEVNATPSRLDLPSDLTRQALDLGCKFIINTDAHHVSGLDDMRFGVSAGRRGWLEAKDVINTHKTIF